MAPALLVFVGGGLGALFRYLAALLVGGPLSTLTVNIAGCFAIGIIAGAVPLEATNVRLFFMTGVLGGFTTFSAFSLDALAMWQRGETAAALAYVAASVIVGLAAAALGLSLGRAM
jgi:CrcB protein